MNPYEELGFLDHVHKNAPIDGSLEVLFRGAQIAGADFLPLYKACMHASATPVGGWKAFRRAQRAVTLARFFEHTLPLPGNWVECGVFRGFSALLLASIARLHDTAFSGDGLYLLDSFEGLSAPTQQDALGVRETAAGDELVYSHDAGHFSTPAEHVQHVLSEFPNATICKGWIPDTFADLPQSDWAFVHIDVDLYAPTMASLEHFFPRLCPGAVVVNDDFDSPLFPGAGRAWREFFDARGLSYIVLDTGQAIYGHDWPADSA